MKILSVVIPSYNSEAFLTKCINSFVNTDAFEKLDIIIVNDGSTDKTSAIADEYASLYPDSVRVLHQLNKGHGGAVNSGCAEARGKYLKVVDADDTVLSDNISSFLTTLERIETDVVLTHYCTTDISNGEEKKWMCYPKEFDKTITIDEVVSNWNDFFRCFTLHGVTYNTSFYKSVGYKLSENVFYEDHEFSTFPLCFASGIVPIDLFVYNYRVGDIAQSVSERNQLARMNDMRTVLCRFAKEYKSLSDNQHIKEFVSLKTKILLVSYLTTALLVEKDKKQGRAKAKEIMDFMSVNFSRAYELSIKQYKTFRLLNLFGIKKKTLDRILTSRLYLKLKGTHSFD